MLKNWNRPEKPEGEEIKLRLKNVQERLASLQMKLKDRKLPVLVLIEAGAPLERAAPSARSSATLIRAFSWCSPWLPPPEEERRKPFCTAILTHSRGREIHPFCCLLVG